MYVYLSGSRAEEVSEADEEKRHSAQSTLFPPLNQLSRHYRSQQGNERPKGVLSH